MYSEKQHAVLRLVAADVRHRRAQPRRLRSCHEGPLQEGTRSHRNAE